VSDTPNPSVPIELTQTSAGILDSKSVQAQGGTNDATDQADAYLNAHSAGTGPYMIDSVDRTAQIVLKANPHYWGSRPAYTTVILRNAPPASQALDVQDGQAKLAIDISAQNAASMNSSVNVIAAPSEDQFHIDLNNSSAVSSLTANQNFRDAVRYGLDYKGLVALAGRGAIQSTGFLPVGVLGALPSSSAIQRDVARAKSALAQTGVSNPTIDLTYYTDQANGGLPLAPMATKIQSDLKEVGININLVGAPIGALSKSVRGGKVAWLIRTTPADYPDPADFIANVPGPAGYLVDARQNWKVGMDPSIDALVSTATSATVPSVRGQAYQALVKATNDKALQIYIVQLGRVLVADKSVHATLNPFDYVDLATVT
jgi:peptide/nickel transport system substrate-binding protein